jgi:hypothetical protein
MRGARALSQPKDLIMGKKNRSGNREPKKPKQPKLPVQAATSIAELGKLQNLPKKGGK